MMLVARRRQTLKVEVEKEKVVVTADEKDSK